MWRGVIRAVRIRGDGRGARGVNSGEFMMHVHMTSGTANVGEALQMFLQGGSRVLLMIAMALFLAYMIFFLATVSIASAITTWHHIRRHPRQALHSRAMAPAVPAEELRQQQLPTGGRHTLRTGS